MKSSFGKLRKFALHKKDAKDRRNSQSLSQSDELAQAAQDMQDMRNCYDSLLSAAAATANSAYEFSESLREMGSCLLERTPLNEDEESGDVLFMLGKVQLEIQKLVDCYRSHIVLTITNPSESLLNELRTVEDYHNAVLNFITVIVSNALETTAKEMKRQCDEKRQVYEYMLGQQEERGKSKSGKSETFTPLQLRTAHNEYDEEATLCVFRLKSLKQGQSRSLLTQAARHHAAQLNFFRKGLKSLDAVEPHVRSITEQQHIDYQFSGLEDDVGDSVDVDDQDGNDANDNEELSFNYRQNTQGHDIVSKSGNSMELDDPVDMPFRQASPIENTEGNMGRHVVSSREPRVGSHSAPILTEKKSDPSEMRQTQPSTRKLNTYVLPTPTLVNANSSIPPRSSTSAPRSRPTNLSVHTHNLWHSSPLEPPKYDNDVGDDTSRFTKSNTTLVVKQSNINETSIQLPPPSSLIRSDSKKVKRHAFSGPLTNKPSISGVRSKISPSASPPPASSPKISELHELPRPPGDLVSKPSKYPSQTGHSAPLFFKNQDISPINRIHFVRANMASPLPVPPLSVTRSFSSPSSSRRAMTLHMAKILDSPKILDKAKDVASPPLTPISLININPMSTNIGGGS